MYFQQADDEEITSYFVKRLNRLEQRSQDDQATLLYN